LSRCNVSFIAPRRLDLWCVSGMLTKGGCAGARPEYSDVCFWHLADIEVAPRNVRCWGQSGHLRSPAVSCARRLCTWRWGSFRIPQLHIKVPAGLAICRSRGLTTPPVAADISRNDVSSTLGSGRQWRMSRANPSGRRLKAIAVVYWRLTNSPATRGSRCDTHNMGPH